MENNSPRTYQTPLRLSPALLLDLDGTVRYSAAGTYINDAVDVRLYDDVEDKLWEYRDQGYLICGVSNQGGIAFGLKTLAQNHLEVDATVAAFQHNPFHMIKICVAHPKGRVEPYCHRSLLRKPDIGLLVLCEVEAFQNGYVIDWDGSLMVGDRLEDQQCAERAGIAFQWAHVFFGRSVSVEEITPK